MSSPPRYTQAQMRGFPTSMDGATGKTVVSIPGVSPRTLANGARAAYVVTDDGSVRWQILEGASRDYLQQISQLPRGPYVRGAQNRPIKDTPSGRATARRLLREAHLRRAKAKYPKASAKEQFAKATASMQRDAKRASPKSTLKFGTPESMRFRGKTGPLRFDMAGLDDGSLSEAEIGRLSYRPKARGVKRPKKTKSPKQAKTPKQAGGAKYGKKDKQRGGEYHDDEDESYDLVRTRKQRQRGGASVSPAQAQRAFARYWKQRYAAAQH